VRRPASVISLALTLAAAVAGCGSRSATQHQTIRGTTLTIYSSVPLHGASRMNAQAVVNGEQLALQQAHGRVGRYRIVLRSLDDSTVQRQAWDPGTTTVNARTAITDPNTVLYIGELNSGASAVSIPLLNRVGIPQISPTSTAVGLTSADAGAAPGEPLKYYPTGVRTFARIVPNDAIQARVQIKLQKAAGCRRPYVLDDGEVDGEDLADSYQLVARSAGLHVLGVQAFQRRATDYAALARSVAQTGADCVLISSLTESGAALLTRQIAAAMPNAQLFASTGLAESTFVDPSEGGIPVAIDPRIVVTSLTLAPTVDPPSARSFYAAYERRYGFPQPYAIFGYDSMSLALNAIARASDGGRDAVRRADVREALFTTRDRSSVLGTYSITSAGDTTIRRYGVYRVVGGQLVYWKSVDG
jgi:branched-chain amino acid transport system substrate-binding protein